MRIRSAQFTQNHNQMLDDNPMLDIPGALLHHFPLKYNLRSRYDVIESPDVFCQ